MTGAELKYIRWAIGGLSDQEAADRLSIHIKTYRRHERAGLVPPAVALSVCYLAGVVCDPEWSGWLFRKGKLCSPDKQEYAAGLPNKK